jgi:membrane-bound metal-dependent hydrolase YbcI (DUF457 family)
MEWITHTTTGFFVGQALLKPDERPKRAGWWWTIASVCPDWLEVGTRYFGDIHRGVTHSLYAWPILALIWALAAKRWGGQPAASLIRLWVVFVAIIGSHLFLDVLMAYRWYLSWPFSQVNWAWDIMPFYDVFIFAGWVILLIAHHWRRLPSMRTAKLGLAIFLAVFALRSAGKLLADVLAERLLAGTKTAASMRTMPVYYQPWIWYASPSGSRRDSSTPINILTGQIVSPAQIVRPFFPPLPQFIQDLRHRPRT